MYSSPSCVGYANLGPELRSHLGYAIGVFNLRARLIYISGARKYTAKSRLPIATLLYWCIMTLAQAKLPDQLVLPLEAG